jgi:hypothetical protein
MVSTNNFNRHKKWTFIFGADGLKQPTPKIIFFCQLLKTTDTKISSIFSAAHLKQQPTLKISIFGAICLKQPIKNIELNSKTTCTLWRNCRNIHAESWHVRWGRNISLSSCSFLSLLILILYRSLFPRSSHSLSVTTSPRMGSCCHG